MGRWGWRLFEGDQDLDIACALPKSLSIKNTGKWLHSLSEMIHQTDKLAPQGAREIYKTQEYVDELANEIVPWVRTKLNTDNLGDRLFAASRARESEQDAFPPNEYKIIVLGALMMRAGAKIKNEDLQHLRELVPRIHCSAGYALPIGDEGFRAPGRAQFLAALDHYQEGVPRNFQEPSYFHCGQVKGDVGHGLLVCGRCKGACCVNVIIGRTIDLAVFLLGAAGCLMFDGSVMIEFPVRPVGGIMNTEDVDIGVQ
ncbi:hypothetical protein FE257_008220 [Aspergillus nanangensis]|uniref:Uncharacterized protein n=1 Tax=Aspergillus nanangensis TaxID=2582783 RepID=A0AAD4GTP7_ASPNN|nr:hypothetical protein FE257_008220 [Aspergillus nanangensis]